MANNRLLLLLKKRRLMKKELIKYKMNTFYYVDDIANNLEQMGDLTAIQLEKAERIHENILEIIKFQKHKFTL